MAFVNQIDGLKFLASTACILPLVIAVTGINSCAKVHGGNSSRQNNISRELFHHPVIAPLSSEISTLSGEEILVANSHRFAGATFAERVNHDQLFFLLSEHFPAMTSAKTPRILIHFDYHSDLYRNNSHIHGAPNIGNYVNFMIYKRLVDEVWWILPDHSRSKQRLSSQWGCSSIFSQNELYWGRPHSLVDWQFRDGPPDQKICVSASGSFQFVANNDGCSAGSRIISFKKRSLSDILLPHHQPLKGTIILDIDADFFDHSGLYANEHPINKAVNIGPNPRCYSLHYAPPQMEVELRRFALAITSGMDLYPDYIFVSRSPEYATKNMKRLNVFFQRLAGLSKESSGSQPSLQPPRPAP